MDFAIGAEEMVETLTDKNLELGEEIESLKETVQELVSLNYTSLHFLFIL